MGSSLGNLGDRSVGDFAAGVVEGSQVAAAAGEVILAPAVAAEFGGPQLPDGWSAAACTDGGRATFGSGALLLDGARVGTDALYRGTRSLEFEASFAARPEQHVGFGMDFVHVPWVMFSTKWGRRLYARTHFVIQEDKKLAGDWFDAPHRFRIDWRVLDVVFSVDGEAVARILVPMPPLMRPLAGNARLGGAPLQLAWMRMGPYRRTGRFTSRVLDAGGAAQWGAATWDADEPEGTAVALQVRTGDTASPDRSWSRWAAVAAGAAVGARSRALQYRAELSTSDPARTPALRGVTVAYLVSSPEVSAKGP